MDTLAFFHYILSDLLGFPPSHEIIVFRTWAELCVFDFKISQGTRDKKTSMNEVEKETAKLILFSVF